MIIRIARFDWVSAALLATLALGCSQAAVHADNADGASAGSAVAAADDSSSNAGADAAAAADLPVAPDFTLVDVNGYSHTLSDYTNDGKIVVLEWFNPDCPVSKRYHSPERKMAALFEEIRGDDVVWLAINSGAPGKQGHGLDRNKQAAVDYQVAYPLLLDEDGAVGHEYDAKTTPHMYIITPERLLIYAGAIDGTNAGEPDVNYVRQAIAEYRAGQPVSTPRTKAFGCSVKYAN